MIQFKRNQSINILQLSYNFRFKYLPVDRENRRNVNIIIGLDLEHFNWYNW